MREFLGAEWRRFRNTCIWSLDGWRAAWRTEKSLRQWALANAVSAVLAVTLDLSATERAVILGLGFLVLAAELANTAIEEIVDNISPDPAPFAKKAKDCGSACVALAAIAAGAAWLAILIG